MLAPAERVRNFLPKRTPPPESTFRTHSLGGQKGSVRTEPRSMPQIGPSKHSIHEMLATLPQTPDGVDRLRNRFDTQASGAKTHNELPKEVAVFQPDAQTSFIVTPRALRATPSAPVGVDGLKEEINKVDRRRKGKRVRRALQAAGAGAAAAAVLAACSSSAPAFPDGKNATHMTVDCVTNIIEPDVLGNQLPAGQQTLLTINANSRHAAAVIVPSGGQVESLVNGVESTESSGNGSKRAPITVLVLESPGKIYLPAGDATAACVFPLSEGTSIKNSIATVAQRLGFTNISETVLSNQS